MGALSVRSAWLWVGLMACACAPDTKYRRTAMVPPVHALAWDGRTAERGTLRIEGAMTHTSVDTNLLPQTGDSALLVPETLVEGAAAVAVTRGFELGARYGFAAYDWAQESAVGTAPIPNRPSLNGFGPEARGTIRFGNDGAFAIGIAGNVLLYGIPTAEWVRDDTCIISSTCIYGWSGISTQYRLVRTDTKSMAVMSFGLYPSYEFSGGKYGHVFGALALHGSFKNDGFSNDPNGSAVEGAGLVPVLGAGYGFHYESFRVSAMLDYPVTSTQSAVYYNDSSFPLSFFVTLGIDLPLFGQRPEEPRGAPVVSAR